MIVDERMVTYIRSLERPENPVIEAIEQEALDSFVPILRKETQSFLKVMMLMNRPASRYSSRIFGDFNERISSGRKPYHNDRKL